MLALSLGEFSNMELQEYIRIVRRRGWIVVLAAVTWSLVLAAPAHAKGCAWQVDLRPWYPPGMTPVKLRMVCRARKLPSSTWK